MQYDVNSSQQENRKIRNLMWAVGIVIFIFLIWFLKWYFTPKIANHGIPCVVWHEKQLYKGKENGCFYVTKNGNHEYVSKKHCKCED